MGEQTLFCHCIMETESHLSVFICRSWTLLNILHNPDLINAADILDHHWTAVVSNVRYLGPPNAPI